MNREALRHLKAGGRVRFKAGGAGGYELLPPEPKITTADMIEQGYLQPDGSRFPGKHPALGAPYGEQATPSEVYWPAALAAEKEQRRAYALSFFKERRARRAYQLLALLGWAAVVVMGVWG